MIKILFTDIDGVLVRRPIDPIPPEVVAAIKVASTKIHISFCTGRNKSQVWPLIEACGLQNEYHILESGTRVLAPKGSWEYVKPINTALIPELLTLTTSLGAEYGICQDDIWHRTIDDVNQQSPVTIFSINTESEEQTHRAVMSLKKHASSVFIGVGTHYANPHGACIQLSDISANKSYGVKHVQKILGIKKGESAAIGDMPMDQIFFRECSFIFAPQDANEQTKKMAHKIVPSVEDFGYIAALAYLTGKKMKYTKDRKKTVVR